MSVATPVPLPTPTRAGRALPFFALVGALGAVVVFSALALWRSEPAPLFWVTFGYLFYELGINVLLVVAAGRGIAQMRRDAGAGTALATPKLPALSVLIAAHNERLCILDTLGSVFAQGGVASLEVIVASDGSTDGMNALLTAQYALDATTGASPDGRLRLLALPKVGKGPALNAALAVARGELVVTLDADTRLAPGALHALAALFAGEPTIASAGGFVYVRNAGPGGPWIARYQFWEYLKNFMWRVGLAHLGVCLQVSGAFGAFRTHLLREELGGFSGRSLVEDYEVIYRLHERLRRAGRAYRVAVAPDAVAFTDGPETVPAFLHQRTRWFTGFLQTLWEYRHLVFGKKMGALGHFMLPIKCVDAVLPLWGALSLGILLAAAFGSAGAHPHGGSAAGWQRAALALFLGKWLADVALSALMWRWHARLFPGRAGIPPLRQQAWFIVTEGLIFNWFRQLAVLNAYGWFVRRVQKWHQPRWQHAAPPPPAAAAGSGN
ncbi:MAG: glycosyltransferase family 2 protein [Verrucomicrobia bacterium]|nr:glycosyltransferase family 2 protein [Verrucomicrobiota bacterium]